MISIKLRIYENEDLKEKFWGTWEFNKLLKPLSRKPVPCYVRLSNIHKNLYLKKERARYFGGRVSILEYICFEIEF